MTGQPYLQATIDLDSLLPHLRHAFLRVSLLRGLPAHTAILDTLTAIETLVLTAHTMLDRAAEGRIYRADDTGNCMTCSNELVSKMGMVVCWNCQTFDTPAEFAERQYGWRAEYAEAAKDWNDDRRVA